MTQSSFLYWILTLPPLPHPPFLFHTSPLTSQLLPSTPPHSSITPSSHDDAPGFILQCVRRDDVITALGDENEPWPPAADDDVLSAVTPRRSFGVDAPGRQEILPRPLAVYVVVARDRVL